MDLKIYPGSSFNNRDLRDEYSKNEDLKCCGRVLGMSKNQYQLFSEKSQLSHGGSLALGKRKTARPLSFKRTIHLVLKTSCHSQLLHHRSSVEAIVNRFSKKFGIKLYQLAVHTDHVHIHVKLSNRILYCRWIRAITSQLACRIKGLKWSLCPWTRVVSWGRDFKRLIEYIRFNNVEAEFIEMAHTRCITWLDIAPLGIARHSWGGAGIGGWACCCPYSCLHFAGDS